MHIFAKWSSRLSWCACDVPELQAIFVIWFPKYFALLSTAIAVCLGTITFAPGAVLPRGQLISLGENHITGKEKRRKDYAFWRQFNEKPSVIPGCPAHHRMHGHESFA